MYDRRPRPVSWTTRRPVASTLPARFSVSSTKRLALAYLARCAAGGTRIKKGCRADLPEGPLEGDKRGFVHSPASEQVAGERGLFSLLQNYSFATERIAAFLHLLHPSRCLKRLRRERNKPLRSGGRQRRKYGSRSPLSSTSPKSAEKLDISVGANGNLRLAAIVRQRGSVVVVVSRKR